MPEFKQSEGFKLKSGNRTDFKNMGSSPAKQTDNIYSDGTKKSEREVDFSKRHTTEETKDKYWYKVDGKKVNYSQYKAAKEKGVANPNSTNFTDGLGLQTNHPDPWGYKAKHKNRKPKK